MTKPSYLLVPIVSLLLLGAHVAPAQEGAAPAPAPAPAGGPAAAPTPPPKVFLDKPAKIVAYQLRRLTNEQLVAVERKADDKKYVPVHEAILARRGLDRKFREEAVTALATINKTDPAVELLKGMDAAEKGDIGTPGELAGMLLARPADALAAQREKLAAAATGAKNDVAKRAAFAALAVADGKPDDAWKLATDNNALPAMLGGVGLIPKPELRGAFYDRVKPLVTQAPDEATRVAAIDAVGYIPGHEAEVFNLLAGVIKEPAAAPRAAAVGALRRVPADKWDTAQVEPLAQAVVKLVEQTPADQRTTPAAVETIQFGTDLAAALPPEKGAPIRRALRELGVRVVLLKAIREQMAYDLRYFAVQAGKPVQVVLLNEDNMPHNFVLTQPGAMQEVALAGGSMAPPTDPKRKHYVPNSDKVIEATFQAQPAESQTISFTAPAKPGEYPYVCTFPGHWVRMYGVMVVVDDLEAWEQKPTAPTDPIQQKPMTSQKTDPGELQAHEH